jgi:hypothetical protein
MEEAGALIIIDGKATDRGTWHGWESGRKIPKPVAMYELERVFGVEPNVFYPRPDAGEIMPPAGNRKRRSRSRSERGGVHG